MAGLSVEARRRLTLAACVIGSSLAFLDATVVIVALPTIREDLGLGLAGQQWVFVAYSLALAALYLPAGAVGDRWGRARLSSQAPPRLPSRPCSQARRRTARR